MVTKPNKQELKSLVRFYTLLVKKNPCKDYEDKLKKYKKHLTNANNVLQ